MNDDENITKLPVRFKNANPDKSLVFPYEVGNRKCYHRRFVIDETLKKVECADCGESLNPMWVLRHLCGQESNWFHNAAKYQEEMKRLNERQRTKCQHCGQMTRISRR